MQFICSGGATAVGLGAFSGVFNKYKIMADFC